MINHLGVGQRAMGCPGIDDDFGSLPNSKWPFRNSNSPVWASPAMQCQHLNDHAPQGRPAHEIVEEYASDNEAFAEKFLEGWQIMTSNGYSKNDLVEGPQNGWLGYHSLSKQGIEIDDFESYIIAKSPLKFTDPKV